MRALLMAFLLSVTVPALAQQPALNLMPLPASIQLGAGQMILDASFSAGINGHSDPRLEGSVERFLTVLRRQTGTPPLLMRLTGAPQAKFVVEAGQANRLVPELGEDESYRLEITTNNAKLSAATTLGVMRGLETFLQLVESTPQGFAVPALTIVDRPRFPWRGLLIDVARHFIPLDVLERNLDGMAAVKLNVFHWHLSDNQGFRVESKKFPKLTGMGSDGFYYTQDQVRELIAYAAARGIRVVPEFDMPGHSTAWFVGYPELASAPGPYQIERKWGVFDPAMDPSEERTYRFLDKFIGEMSGLFPDRYFHIGGDEVNGKWWDANPKIQAFKRAHGLKTNQDLQAYFNQRVEKIVSKHGKILIGWDEILHPDLPTNIVVQSWRGQESLAQAAKQGFRGILSYGYYLDLMWPAARHYAVDPMSGAAANLSPEEAEHILGGEACMWSEYVSPENLDSRIWPRLAPIAERLWSAPSVVDVNFMYRRLEVTSRWLDWLGLTHNSSYPPMLRRIAGSDQIAALRTLADVVEPVKDYTREETAPLEPTSLMPLDRLIDAARPESATGRHFGAMVDAWLADPAAAPAKEQLRGMLNEWRDNQSSLQPFETQSFLLQEIIPVSQNLTRVATAGLEALGYLERGERPAEGWKSQTLAALGDAGKAQAQLLLVIVPAIEKLVEAAGGGSPAGLSR
ncbi:MAG TPA: family 20 glycosylhydrolase [Terriglobales bacterium]|nr:family 20 glycosylhydrolase [Terriglobales bacterium]